MISIFASGITNLTDARYFAAKGVSHTGIDMLAVSPESAAEMIGWIEGPTPVAEFGDNPSLEAIWETAHKAAIHTIAVNTQFSASELSSLHGLSVFMRLTPQVGLLQDLPAFLGSYTPAVEAFILDFYPAGLNWQALAPYHADIEALSKRYPIFLQLDFAPSDLAAIASIPSIQGLLVKGGDEIITGVKSYEDLDAVFDTIDA